MKILIKATLPKASVYRNNCPKCTSYLEYTDTDVFYNGQYDTVKCPVCDYAFFVNDRQPYIPYVGRGPYGVQ